jgi:hypothetical protein
VVGGKQLAGEAISDQQPARAARADLDGAQAAVKHAIRQREVERATSVGTFRRQVCAIEVRNRTSDVRAIDEKIERDRRRARLVEGPTLDADTARIDDPDGPLLPE